MELTFLGTGEAFDLNRGNYSCLIENGGQSIMVDCGYQAAYSLRRILKTRGKTLLDVPDSILFTHLHGDHFAGTSALIVPMGDENMKYNEQNKSEKERCLTIASVHEDIKERFERRMSEDYPGLLEDSNRGLQIYYLVLTPNSYLNGLSVSFAETQHSVKNYAYRFGDARGRTLAISGDGALTEASKELYKEVDLLVHEGFFLNQKSKTHASIEEIVQFAVQAEIQRLAIVHVNQAERMEGYTTSYIPVKINYAKAKGVELFFPNDGDKITV
jgi:ribonuclease BN (tRNA processing enzyme)